MISSPAGRGRRRSTRVLPLPGLLRRCHGCRGALITAGHFTLHVEGMGELCGDCAPRHLPTDLVPVFQDLRQLAGDLSRLRGDQADAGVRMAVDVVRALAGEAAPAAQPGACRWCGEADCPEAFDHERLFGMRETTWRELAGGPAALPTTPHSLD